MELIDPGEFMLELNKSQEQLRLDFNALEFRLLLVDDDPRLLDSLCALLDGRGYILTKAASGGEAIEQLSRKRFDLVLLDLRLQDMTGYQVMEFILEREIDAHVVVLSGDNAIEAAIGALERGAFGYLRKPYDPLELFKLLDHSAQQRRLQAQNQQMSTRLARSERIYRYLVDNSPDIIYTLNHEGNFTFINNRVSTLLGIERDALIGKHYSELVHEEDLDFANNVFNERRSGDRSSRNVELRLKCMCNLENSRDFDNTIVTIVLNSTGLYSRDSGYSKHEFIGTYGVARDITDRKRAEEMIAYHAYHDVLTDLPNRILFKDRLNLAINQAKRDGSKLAVLFLDLDRFKLVNDTFGHAKGDELLQQVTKRLLTVIRGGDTLARLGGDEFTLVLPNLRNKQDAMPVVSKIQEAISTPFEINKQLIHISVSIGVAIFPEDGESLDELLRHADIAMYQAKSLGMDGYHFYDCKIQDTSHHKIILEQHLRNALLNNELVMHYQPQVDSRSHAIVGVEGLLRWNHPTRGLLGAGEFLPLAEEVKLMIPITEWMLNAACKDLTQWELSGNDDFKLSLNVSPQSLDCNDFPEKLLRVLKMHDVAPDLIEVEITENISIRSPQHAIEQLDKLSKLGITIAIDDFGTGYSSLSYLHKFPVHTVKVDQSFVREIQFEQGHYPVILAIISIAKGLGLRLVAEGVETEQQSRFLENSGCTTLQGFLYHRPMPDAQLRQILSQAH